MSVGAFAHGVVLATGLIVALGPQNVFIFQQGAVQPRLTRALPTVVTAGAADTALILLGVLGVSVVVLEFAWLRAVMLGAGVVFLAYIGWTLVSAPALDLTGNPGELLGARAQIGFTASVSLLNPHAILDTVGVIGTNALAYSVPGRWAFTGGCVLVSWAWFLGLAVAGRAVGDAASGDGWLRRLNTVSAVIIWAVALYLCWQLAGIVGVR